MGNEGSQPMKYGETLENNVKIRWEKLPESASTGLHGRDGHCACVVKDKLYVFGGIVPAKALESGSLESDELLAIDIVNGKSEVVKTNGPTPPPRSAATLAAVDDKLYLFGGLSRETGWFDTVQKFDTATKTWSLLETPGAGPSARDKLASAVVNKNIYIFGGFGPQGMEDEELEESDEDDEEEDGAQFGWFNELFVFNTETNTFSSPMQMNLGCPTPRAAHGMCALDKYLVIFGGRDADARQNDLHIFDTESRKWQSDLVIQGRQPQPRSFHSVTAVGDRVVILGGRGVSDQHFNDFHIFDTAKRHWLQPEVEGDSPCGRGLHTVAVVGDRLVLFGGSGNYSAETMQCSDYYKDIYTVKTADILSGNAKPTDVLLENQENISTNIPRSSDKQSGLATSNTNTVQNQ